MQAIQSLHFLLKPHFFLNPLKTSHATLVFLQTLLITLLLSSCSVNVRHSNLSEKAYQNNRNILSQTALPKPNITTNIAGLGPCDDSEDRSLALNNQHPVNILVHGCHGSAARFKALSKVLAFHGQQTACFSYDDRNSLLTSSRKLANAIEELGPLLQNNTIKVLGHSQGGLVARKALIKDRREAIQATGPIELVTISAPLSGIAAARHCVNPILRYGSLGLNDLLCWVISGDKWYQITHTSPFIQKPGTLTPAVKQYLLIATDERNTCRKHSVNGKCKRSDFIFSLAEQKLPEVTEGLVASEVLVKAGHVEIVGNDDVKPLKLIQTLQEKGFIKPTQAAYQNTFEQLLNDLYALSN